MKGGGNKKEEEKKNRVEGFELPEKRKKNRGG
jgi:hypothetical protein